jgi:hypothetical protein
MITRWNGDNDDNFDKYDSDNDNDIYDDDDEDNIYDDDDDDDDNDDKNRNKNKILFPCPGYPKNPPFQLNLTFMEPRIARCVFI